MAAATREGGGAGEEADVVNPIVFFDITLGGEWVFDEQAPQFFLSLFISPPSPPPSLPPREQCVCFCLFK